MVQQSRGRARSLWGIKAEISTRQPSDFFGRMTASQSQHAQLRGRHGLQPGSRGTSRRFTTPCLPCQQWTCCSSSLLRHDEEGGRSAKLHLRSQNSIKSPTVRASREHSSAAHLRTNHSTKSQSPHLGSPHQPRASTLTHHKTSRSFRSLYAPIPIQTRDTRDYAESLRIKRTLSAACSSRNFHQWTHWRRTSSVYRSLAK